jgi:tetratricopeptide (TPR) repeat protein
MKNYQLFLSIILLVAISCKTEFRKDRIPERLQGGVVLKSNELEADDPDHAIQLARISFSKGNYNAAIDHLLPFYEENQEDFQLANHLAYAYFNNERPELAAPIMEELDKDAVQTPMYLANKAFQSWYSDNLPAALSFITYALNIDPNHPGYRAMSGDIKLALGDTTEALKDFQKSLDMKMQQSLLDKMVMNAYGIREFDLAFNYLRKSYENDPQAEKVLYHAALLHYAIDQKDTANYLIDKAIDANNTEQYQITRAEWLRDDRRYTDALEVTDELIQNDSTSVAAWMLKGRILSDQYRYYSARDAFEKVVEYDSSNTIALQELEKLEKKIAYLRIQKQREENRRLIEELKPIERINQ